MVQPVGFLGKWGVVARSFCWHAHVFWDQLFSWAVKLIKNGWILIFIDLIKIINGQTCIDERKASTPVTASVPSTNSEAPVSPNTGSGSLKVPNSPKSSNKGVSNEFDEEAYEETDDERMERIQKMRHQKSLELSASGHSHTGSGSTPSDTVRSINGTLFFIILVGLFALGNVLANSLGWAYFVITWSWNITLQVI